MEHESDGNINCNRWVRYSRQGIGKGTERIRNKSTSRDHPNDNIIEIIQNTEKSARDLRKLAVTQTKLTLVWKLSKEYNNNNNNNNPKKEIIASNNYS